MSDESKASSSKKAHLGRVDDLTVDAMINSESVDQEARMLPVEMADAYVKRKKADDDSLKIISILNVFEKQVNSDRGLRKYFAMGILIFLGMEIIMANSILLLLGFKLMELPELVINIFFVAVFTKIVSIVVIVANNLFPKAKADMGSLMKDLMK